MTILSALISITILIFLHIIHVVPLSFFFGPPVGLHEKKEKFKCQLHDTVNIHVILRNFANGKKSRGTDAYLLKTDGCLKTGIYSTSSVDV